jgi:hypothetical protein
VPTPAVAVKSKLLHPIEVQLSSDTAYSNGAKKYSKSEQSLYHESGVKAYDAKAKSLFYDNGVLAYSHVEREVHYVSGVTAYEHSTHKAYYSNHEEFTVVSGQGGTVADICFEMQLEDKQAMFKLHLAHNLNATVLVTGQTVCFNLFLDGKCVAAED